MAAGRKEEEKIKAEICINIKDNPFPCELYNSYTMIETKIITLTLKTMIFKSQKNKGI